MCINLDHLEEGTFLENMKDKWERGRHVSAKGERNHSKLKEFQVREILADKVTGHSALGRKYGVSFVTIIKIRNGTKWKHILRE